VLLTDRVLHDNLSVHDMEPLNVDDPENELFPPKALSTFILTNVSLAVVVVVG